MEEKLPVDMTEAIKTASEFLDEYIYQQRGFAPSGKLEEFILEFQEVRETDDHSLLIVFAIQPEEDDDDPDPAIQALAQQCLNTLLTAHEELKTLNILIQYIK